MEEIRRGFHESLDAIQHDVIRLGTMVSDALPRATEVLLTGDLPGAQVLIDADDVLDTLSVAIEESCYHQLALQQPMARDLRAVVTALRLSSELERSGDLVTNICKAARRLFEVPLETRVRSIIEAMSDDAARLLTLAVRSYADCDADLAAALDDMDDHLDTLQADFIAAIFEANTAGSLEIQAAVQLALVGRYYERIGDHAVNVGERVRYLATGWLPEHTGAARLQARSEMTKPE